MLNNKLSGPYRAGGDLNPKSGHTALQRVVIPEQRGQESSCTTQPEVRDYPGGSCPGSSDTVLEKSGQMPEFPTEGLCFQAYSWNLNYSHQ